MLTLRQRIGLNAAPLLLRIVTGAIFVWAGAIKIGDSFTAQGADAAILANMGAITPKSATPAPPAKDKATPPATSPSAPPAPSEPVTSPKTGPAPTKPLEKPADKPADKPIDKPRVLLDVLGNLEPAAQGTPAAPERVYTAADFPEPVKVLSVYQVALALHHASHPVPNEKGVTPMRLWPSALGGGAWPVRFAWLAAITELVGGACVLLGLFTRLSALGLAFVMLVAAWLTVFGPAIQSGTGRLGFIPAHAWNDGVAWQMLWMQACLFVMALALVTLGSGRLGLDHMVLGRRDDDDLD